MHHYCLLSYAMYTSCSPSGTERKIRLHLGLTLRASRTWNNLEPQAVGCCRLQSDSVCSSIPLNHSEPGQGTALQLMLLPNAQHVCFCIRSEKGMSAILYARARPWQRPYKTDVTRLCRVLSARLFNIADRHQWRIVLLFVVV